MASSNKDQPSESTSMLANVNIDITSPAADSTVTHSASQQSKLAEMDTTGDNARVGLNKEELMKFANQPYWVRLRNFLFAAFWILWLSILGAAIGYVVQSPGCGPAKGAGLAGANATTTASLPSSS